MTDTSKTKTWTILLCACLCAALWSAAPAAAAGLGEMCGGIAGIACDTGLACKYPMGECNVSDLAGMCVRLPDPCPKGPPVCGCDGKTYSSECELVKSGVHGDKPGACKKSESTGAMPGLALAVPAAAQPAKMAEMNEKKKACTSNADCASGSFCEQPSGACSGAGSCLVKPQACTQQFDPVCGCDGKTYGNACTRQMAGVSQKSTGECPKT